MGGLLTSSNFQTGDESGGLGFPRELTEARHGSSEQKAELLESFRDYLRQLAAKTIDGNNANGKLSASDLVQSAIIDACKDFAHCKAASKEEFKSWLRQIMMNDILDKYRSLRSKKRDVGLERSLEANQLFAPEDKSPVAEAQRKEDERRLVQAISTLSGDHQTIIRMRHQEKLTVAQIAKAMDRTTSGVRKLWSRAVEELSKKM